MHTDFQFHPKDSPTESKENIRKDEERERILNEERERKEEERRRKEEEEKRRN